MSLIPLEIIEEFNLLPDLVDPSGNNLLHLNCPPDSPIAEISLYHQYGFRDPILYGEITDTINNQIHVLFCVINNPHSPRFDIDTLPDGTPTNFGTLKRNIEAEIAAMEYGLSPGQIRKGLRILGSAIKTFEDFVSGLGHELYFVEPLFYHNAVIFERYGFVYARGRKLMERINAGFTSNGDLLPLLDNSTPFRCPLAANSIRLRSWAIHDNILGHPFDKVTMYKWIGKTAKINTCSGCTW